VNKSATFSCSQVTTTTTGRRRSDVTDLEQSQPRFTHHSSFVDDQVKRYDAADCLGRNGRDAPAASEPEPR